MSRRIEVRSWSLGLLLACALAGESGAQEEAGPNPPSSPAPAEAPPAEEPPAEEEDDVEAPSTAPEPGPVDVAPAAPIAEEDATIPSEDDEAYELEVPEDVVDTSGAMDLGGSTDELTLENVFHSGGSVGVVDQQQLDRLGYQDPTNVLQRVPGITIRVEDGFGLRPNIGIRGTNPERSRSVTLMEDGVLFGPAPYSAPAAYYFPLVSRMVGVEVYKGPAAILYGPQTVGGAVNFLSRDVPSTTGGEIRLAYGSYGNRLLHARYGLVSARAGISMEVVDLGSRGFKEIDHYPRNETGFARTEALLRGFVQSRTTRPVYHRLGLKLTYSRERSNETYLGLTDADLRENPDRRYVASSGDVMRWQRFAYELEHRLETRNHVSLTTTLYRHDFHRLWHRFDRFGGNGPSVLDVLANPSEGSNQLYYGYLTGEENSEPLVASSRIVAANNDRTFVSQGIQSTLSYARERRGITHRLRIGVRLHHDTIRRRHTGESYLVQNQQLVRDGTPETLDTNERASSLAFAAYGAYALEVGRLRLTPGVRTEIVRGVLAKFGATDTRVTGVQGVILGGLGANVEVAEDVSVFAGIHRGFGPVAPGSNATASPELSIDYEVGARYLNERRGIRADVTAYLNDYSNMLLTCSEIGCSLENVDKQYNAGAALVGGVEASGSASLELPHDLRLPLTMTYAYQRSRFLDSFTSGDVQYANVKVGDEIPYLPRHQGTLAAGLEHERFRVNVTGTFVAAMREQSGRGHEGFWTERQAFLDLSGEVRLHARVHLTLRLENVTNSRPIVAHRPFGARPYRPFMAQAGLRVEL